MKSPCQRSLEKLRADGWTTGVVEKWIPASPAGFRGPIVRQDLYGFIDVLAIRDGEILAVQVTTGANVAARLAKIDAEPRAKTWLSAGGKIVVHGWSKQGARGKRKMWTLREVPIGVPHSPAVECARSSETNGPNVSEL
jgi:hypothetical protein